MGGRGVDGAMSAITAPSFLPASSKCLPSLWLAPPSAPWLLLGLSEPSGLLFGLSSTSRQVISLCPALLWEGTLLRQKLQKNIPSHRPGPQQSSRLSSGCYLDDRANPAPAHIKCCLGLGTSLKTCFKCFISLHLPQGGPTMDTLDLRYTSNNQQ